MRSQLIIKSNKSFEEYTLRNIFRSFDMDSNGVLSVSEIRGLCSSLGICATDSELNALFRRLDKNQSGVIEFEEFHKLLLEDPYK
jgi:Ca2+-binding EF-hand superfamily protein